MISQLKLALDLPYAHGGPVAEGEIKLRPEDFLVDEICLVEPDGEGEHCLLQVEKRNCNTEWVARLLARHAEVPRRDVSYAGMKDRQAVTRQWFSVRLAGRPDPDWNSLDRPDIRVLKSARHRRKLRTGALKGNYFHIVVRHLQGDEAGLEQRLRRLSDAGIPNFFGEQRFGREGANLEGAKAMFEGGGRRLDRQKRGLYLSAARSLLFNRVLAHRVTAGNWDHALPGERLLLDGSRNSFLAEAVDQETTERVARMDLHPSGPLWGLPALPVAADVERLERQVLADAIIWREGLERAGLKQERRSLRAPVRELQWSLDGGRLELEFQLPKGGFATTLLRECVRYQPVSSLSHARLSG